MFCLYRSCGGHHVAPADGLFQMAAVEESRGAQALPVNACEFVLKKVCRVSQRSLEMSIGEIDARTKPLCIPSPP